MSDADGTPRFRWSQRDLEELEALYWEHVAPAMEADGRDPTRDRPSYRWLVDHGFGGIQYALREHHGYTVKEFLVEVVGLPDENEFRWGIDDGTTRETLERYLAELADRRGLESSTVASKRARLARYARAYADVNDRTDLLAGVADETRRPSEMRRVLGALDAVGKALSTDESRLQYLGDVRGFYAHLERRGRAAYNPLADAAEEFPWERDEPDNPALDATDVRALHEAAADSGERLLVVGLAGWGLRPSELAGLHRSQVRLTADDPHLAFETRKNGPGTVSLLFGLDALAERLEAVEDADWSGYLFPSERSASGHVVPDTIRARFKRLAGRADVRVDGTTPTPRTARRFWYATYVDATAAALDHLDGIAADQGSASPEVVFRNYLSETRRRAIRRRFMRESLAEAFDAAAD